MYRPIQNKRLFMGKSEPLSAYSSGYGHSSSGHGGYGSHSSGYGSDCCPLVVDPLTWLALLSFIGAATYLLNEVIAMSMLMMMRRRKRSRIMSFRELNDLIKSGRLSKFFVEIQTHFV